MLLLLEGVVEKLKTIRGGFVTSVKDKGLNPQYCESL